MRADERGRVETLDAESGNFDALASGDLDKWLATIVDGVPLIHVSGDGGVGRDCLGSLHQRPWTPSPS